jgi:hypothetical protein
VTRHFERCCVVALRLVVIFDVAIRLLLAVQFLQLDGHVFIDRTGVRLLFGDAQFGEPVENLMSFDFQLSRQLVDPNLLHRKSNLLLLVAAPY